MLLALLPYSWNQAQDEFGILAAQAGCKQEEGSTTNQDCQRRRLESDSFMGT
jgi:hypothetical protein